jgi:oxygen-independent coproporphyrinogen-3 oxidase
MSDPLPRAAYVHVPFCARRCGYCDFTLLAGRDELVDAYLDALARELSALPAGLVLDTLFLGGGTPSRPSPAQLARLFEILRAAFTLAPHAEVSLEANPLDLGGTDPECLEKVRVLAEAGVNRISLGVQSFDAEILARLDRDHRAAEIERAVGRCRTRFASTGLDLIFGVPGQSLALWDATLDRALALHPTHVSTYGLTIEKGTAFWSQRRRGALVPLAEETERAMYAAAMDRLPAAGLAQYEISNFAAEGFRCRHNETYWTGGDFLGFGPGAASFVGGTRRINHRSTTTWLKRIRAGLSPVAETERLNDEERAREALVIGLRQTCGVERAAFRARTGCDLDALCGAALARHAALGLIEDDGTAVRLTRSGRFVADAVIVDLV